MAASAPSTLPSKPADYDLLHRMSEFLDLHMIFPLIQHCEQLNTVYKPEELARTRTELLEFTHIAPKTPEQKQALEQELAQLQASAQSVIALQNNETALGELRANNKRIVPSTLEASHGISAAALDAFFRLGKFQYESGKYEEATAILALFRELTLGAANQEDAILAERSFDALWGKLAAEICQMVHAGKTEVAPQALQDVKELSKLLDARDNNPLRNVNHLEQLQFRRWLLHWSLFAFFFQEQKSGLVDFTLGEVSQRPKSQTAAGLSQEHLRNRNVLENHCPWLLRYVVAAHLVNKNRKFVQTKDLVLLVEQESHYYSDPLCELFLVLSSPFDMERALHLVKKCELVFEVDFFLARWKHDLLVNIRQLIFEMHCKLSAKVDISQLCKQLGGTEEEAQLFAQEFFKKTQQQQIVAKLDAETNKLVMTTSQVPVWQVCGDKIKDITARTAALENGILAMQNEGTM